jgi:hypothetical protein
MYRADRDLGVVDTVRRVVPLTLMVLLTVHGVQTVWLESLNS